jgi:hypothetical protein
LRLRFVYFTLFVATLLKGVNVVMNKQFEAGLLVAVAVLVTMSATTIYHITNKGDTNPVDRYVVHEWENLSHWVKNNVAKEHPNNGGTTNHSDSNITTEIPVPAINTNANIQGVSIAQKKSDDGDTYKKLTQISEAFVRSMSQSDWQTLVQALTHDDTGQANVVVAHIIQSHISSADLAWIKSHFQGSQTFNEEDVSLLQNSIVQAVSELTPQEMNLLKQVLPVISSAANEPSH